VYVPELASARWVMTQLKAVGNCGCALSKYTKLPKICVVFHVPYHPQHSVDKEPGVVLSCSGLWFNQSSVKMQN
jgi:hypothetical protein